MTKSLYITVCPEAKHITDRLRDQRLNRPYDVSLLVGELCLSLQTRATSMDDEIFDATIKRHISTPCVLPLEKVPPVSHPPQTFF